MSEEKGLVRAPIFVRDLDYDGVVYSQLVHQEEGRVLIALIVERSCDRSGVGATSYSKVIMDAVTGKIAATLTGHSPTTPLRGGLLMLRGGKTLATMSYDAVQLWDVQPLIKANARSADGQPLCLTRFKIWLLGAATPERSLFECGSHLIAAGMKKADVFSRSGARLQVLACDSYLMVSSVLLCNGDFVAACEDGGLMLFARVTDSDPSKPPFDPRPRIVRSGAGGVI